MRIPSALLGRRWLAHRLLWFDGTHRGILFGGTVTLKVDPEALRAFAASVTGTAEAIAEWNIGEPFEQSQSALPGTDFAELCVRTNLAAAFALSNVHSRLLEIADLADGSANDYEITEADFVAALSAMDLPR
ncbi:hypothetical protein ACWDUD_15760 [Rhodococcus sp. NPDC003382]